MNETAIPIHAIKGRGAATRMARRFESVARDAFDDGWCTQQESIPDGPLPLVTEVTLEDAKSAISRNDSPDIHFDYEAGARNAFYTVLRLPWELNPLFQQWLALHYPQRAARVMARIQEMRGGKDYDSSFATRMKGHGLWADLIHQRFEKTCARLGLNRERDELDVSQFRSSLLAGQADLF